MALDGMDSSLAHADLADVSSCKREEMQVGEQAFVATKSDG